MGRSAGRDVAVEGSPGQNPKPLMIGNAHPSQRTRRMGHPQYLGVDYVKSTGHPADLRPLGSRESPVPSKTGKKFVKRYTRVNIPNLGFERLARTVGILRLRRAKRAASLRMTIGGANGPVGMTGLVWTTAPPGCARSDSRGRLSLHGLHYCLSVSAPSTACCLAISCCTPWRASDNIFCSCWSSKT
jgi:hypothetical protein